MRVGGRTSEFTLSSLDEIATSHRFAVARCPQCRSALFMCDGGGGVEGRDEVVVVGVGGVCTPATLL